MPLGPQSFSLVTTSGGARTLPCGKGPVCPGNCSGRGACSGGRCVCDAERTGLDCSLSRAVVGCGQQHELRLSPGGLSGYLLGLAGRAGLWNLSLNVSQGEVEFAVACNRTPGSSDFSESVAANASARFVCWTGLCAAPTANGARGCLLAVAARCCDSVVAVAELECGPAWACAPKFVAGINGTCIPASSPSGDPSMQQSSKTPHPVSASTAIPGSTTLPLFTSSQQEKTNLGQSDSSVQGETQGAVGRQPLVISSMVGHGEAVTSFLSRPQVGVASGTDVQSNQTANVTLAQAVTETRQAPAAFTVVLPMTRAAFQASESQFAAAVAEVAGCSPALVHVIAVRDVSSVAGTRRRLPDRSRAFEAAVEVDTEIAQAPGLATEMGQITLQRLDDSLRHQGLPTPLALTLGLPPLATVTPSVPFSTAAALSESGPVAAAATSTDTASSPYLAASATPAPTLNPRWLVAVVVAGAAAAVVLAAACSGALVYRRFWRGKSGCAMRRSAVASEDEAVDVARSASRSSPILEHIATEQSSREMEGQLPYPNTVL